ncbi:GAF domain-containing SpoIIE family protein phosphatase [Leptospira ilyithenensis]|uniref:GAF domain-containing protein n=1 Tax=Leptospira ilyithenensis TaxID=2484901 RepID=A0A4R9LQY0_9LEPT|nr:GAF domain-containing SpoIIE family protein phosphatase [Leptospira ilyithenensis]TGN11995.1 GAF domain-containing protein [Leptospira ilyithenensis]
MESNGQYVRTSRLESFIKFSSDPIWCYEVDIPMPTNLPVLEQAKYLFEHSIVKECNLATAKIYGFTKPDDMIGKYIKDLIPLQDFSPIVRFVESGYEFSNEEYLEVLSENRKRNFIINVHSELLDGKFVRCWGQQKEITLMKATEEKLNALLRLSEILNEISRVFVFSKAEFITDAVQFALEKIGEYTSADRAFIMEISQDRQSMSFTHEWLNEGVESAVLVGQDLPISSMNPENLAILMNDGILFMPDSRELPEGSWVRGMMEKTGVRSSLSIGLRDEGNLMGIMGVVRVHKKYEWPKESHNLLSLAADLISQGMLRARSELVLHAKERKLQNFYSEITEDLMLARLTQESWIAKDFPNYNNVRFFSNFFPYGEIGGDIILYDSPSPDYIDILFGDISGHGISSALVSGIVAMGFKKHSDSRLSPKDLLKALNTELEPVMGKHHISCCLVRIYHETREVVFCFAGHPPLLIWNTQKKEKIQSLIHENYPLLLIEEWEGIEIKYQFQPKDRLFLYSDGIYEVENKDRDGVLGLEKFLVMVDELKDFNTDGEDFLTSVVTNAVIREDRTIRDDIALLLIEFT